MSSSYILDIIKTIPVKLNTKKRNWYGRLKNANDGVPYLLGYETLQQNNIIIYRENIITGSREFCLFYDYIDFGRYFIDETQECERCFFEEIMGDQPQKPYFDIDKKLDGNMTLTPQIVDNFILHFVNALKNASQNKITNSDIMLFSSNRTFDTEKFSMHVVVDNWCFVDNNDMNTFCHKVIDYLPEVYKSWIDTRIYSKIRAFRTYGSHKFNKPDRKKLLINDDKYWQITEVPSSDKHRELMIIGASLVMNSSYCKIIDTYPKPIPKSISYEDYDIKKEEIEKALDLCAVNEGAISFNDPRCPYTYKEFKKGIIVLLRRYPSKCKCCERVHDSENPFIIITQSKGVYFDCRRNDQHKTTYLGLLQSFEESKPQEIECTIPVVPVVLTEDKNTERKIELNIEKYVVPQNLTKSSLYDISRNMKIQHSVHSKRENSLNLTTVFKDFKTQLNPPKKEGCVDLSTMFKDFKLY